ncbi:thermonuclease family protein [Synechococcus sp. CB0101]|uniref:thermonuclease family protein n=1 Tax=Synechococcus sp. CB0101 TaxID=232348 RepID=UPI0003165C74|nr:thermonuclease family protein [Synechococcus sp. CB0101]
MRWLGIAVVVLLHGPGAAQPLQATVISIGDGDTLRVREGNRAVNVRLAFIDAPESSQAPFGAQARQQLQALAPVGSSVELRIKATDRYGRSVAELTRGGRNLNQAWWPLAWPLCTGSSSVAATGRPTGVWKLRPG